MAGPLVSDYDKFVSFCTTEFQRNPGDPALRYFDNRFYNRQVDNQTGHLRQAFYAAKEFFTRIPKARTIPSNLVRDGRLRTNEWRYLRDWIRFVQRDDISLPPGASMKTIYKILPQSLGGSVDGGGGAGPSFKVVIPLVARYLAARGEGVTPIGADRWDAIEEALAPAQRRELRLLRIIRDSKKSLQLKELYRHCCQVCGRRIQIRVGGYYSEAHHLRPLGGRHNGPDIRGNMLVLCPWHHAEFDYFLFRIDSNGGLEHRLRELQKNERTLSVENGHVLGSEYLKYNNDFYLRLTTEHDQE